MDIAPSTLRCTVPLGLALIACNPPTTASEPLDDRLDAQQDRSTEAGAPTRFVVLGDGGKGNDGQRAVAAAVGKVCARRTDDAGPGCGFALYLGDNIYDEGVLRVDDPLFDSHFETPYAALDFPFLVVLGNHDYGNTSLDAARSDPQVAYTARSAKWTLPARFYDLPLGPHHFIGLDTNALLLEGLWGDSGQRQWVEGPLSRPAEGWRVGFGHHPYRSNGFHGNAGNYEGLWWLPVVRGTSVETFFEDHACGRFDVYFSGHDHNLQWLEPVCGTHFMVSGSAARPTPLENRDHNPTWFSDDTGPGFIWVELLGREMTAVFHDSEGTELFRKSVSRIRSQQAAAPTAP